MTDSKRAAYLRGEVTHEEYYGMIVELLGESALRSALPGSRGPSEWSALVDRDHALNNVRLKEWDSCDGIVRALAFRADRDALRSITGTGNAWSLGDSVCTLKAVARRYAKSATDAEVCAGTGRHDGQDIDECDECDGGETA